MLKNEDITQDYIEFEVEDPRVVALLKNEPGAQLLRGNTFRVQVGSLDDFATSICNLNYELIQIEDLCVSAQNRLTGRDATHPW